jgi:hypothetical protein
MLELIVPDAGSPYRGECYVSISGKFRRILLYKEAYAEMRRNHKKDFDYVQFWSDSERPNRFWIRAATKGAEGCTRIVLNPRNGSRTISAAYLLKFLDWSRERSLRCPLRWDMANDAAVVLTGQTEG